MSECLPADPASRLRVFIAAHPPESITKHLDSVLAGLQHAVPRHAVRWVRAENVHLTMRFIGDIPADAAPALKAAVAEAIRGVSPIVLRLSAPGCFPNPRAPRVLWIGLAGELDALAALHRNVTEATQTWGKPEARDFHPHLTLGRVATHRRDELQTIATALSALQLPATNPWPVTTLHLMQSDLQPSGAVYTSLAQFSLA